MSLSPGLVHTVPKDVRDALSANARAMKTWEDITPLARNEWLCWMISAKKQETREKRIAWGCKSLASGKRRPCCWAGCTHRVVR